MDDGEDEDLMMMMSIVKEMEKSKKSVFST